MCSALSCLHPCLLPQTQAATRGWSQLASTLTLHMPSTWRSCRLQQKFKRLLPVAGSASVPHLWPRSWLQQPCMPCCSCCLPLHEFASCSQPFCTGTASPCCWGLCCMYGVAACMVWLQNLHLDWDHARPMQLPQYDAGL